MQSQIFAFLFMILDGLILQRVAAIFLMTPSLPSFFFCMNVREKQILTKEILGKLLKDNHERISKVIATKKKQLSYLTSADV